MSKNFIIISKDSDLFLKKNLKLYGEVLEISPSEYLDRREGAHPDMRICKITDSCCIVAPDIVDEIECFFKKFGISFCIGKTFLKKKYPENIAYNVLVGDKIFFHNTEYTDGILLDKLYEMKKDAVFVKQGYSGCSSIFAGNVLITSDYGIYKKASSLAIETVLFENPERILLDGFDHGFIGGCCGYNNETGLLINCSENFLPFDFKENLNKKDIKYTCIGNGPLTDIGGIVIFTSHC